MGGAAEAVGNAFESVGDVIESVGDIAGDVVREVGHAVESVGREVGKIGQAAIDDPVGTIAKAAAIASGQWWALPLVSAGLVIANGGDIGQAALAAGISLAAQGAAYGVTEYLSAGSAAALDMAAADTASLAAEGLTAGQIAQIAAQSYPEIGASAITKMAEMAVMGIPAAQMATEIGSQMAIQNIGAAAAGNTLGAGTRTALSGGDLSEILKSAGTAGLGTAVGGGTSLGLTEAGVGSTVAGAIGKGTGAAVATAASGKDGTAAFLNSLINTSLSEAGKQTKSFLKDAWGKVTTSVDEYNKQLETTNATQAKLDPLYKTAKEAEAAINAELAAYQPVRDKFSNLVTQYDEAKAAGNTELANSLADQANAIIPELNAATNKYNTAYADYEAKVTPYITEAKSYENSIKKVDELKSVYVKSTEELAAESKALTEAAAKVVDMPEPVQNAFAQMYQNGISIDAALANSTKLNGMTPIAQETFIRDMAANNDTDSALAYASQINGLNTKQQNAFQTAIDQGLPDATALLTAPVISNFDTRQQIAYTEALVKGSGSQEADLIAAFASFNDTPVGQSVAEKNAANLAKLDTPELKQAYRQLSSTVSPDEALRTAQGLQALTSSSVMVSQDKSPLFGAPVLLTDEEIKNKYLAQVNADVKAGRMTAAEADKELADLGISKTTSVLNIGDSTGQAGPNTGLINTGTGTGGASLDSPNSLYTPLSFGADGTKKYYTGDGEIYSLVNINGEPTLLNDKDNTQRIPINFAKDVDPVTGQIVTKTPVKQTSTIPGGNNAPAGGTPSGATGATGAAGDPASGTTGTPTYTPYTISDALSKYNGTADFTNGAGGTAGTPTTGPTSPTAGTTTGTGTSSAATGTGTGTSTTGTGTGSGTTGTGTGAGGTGTGTGTGSGSGTGIGLGLGAGVATAGSGYSGWQALQSQDQYGGIKNLTPGLTERMDYTLSGLPVDSNQDTVNPMSDIREMATGGSSSSNTYDPFSTKDVSGSGISGSLTPGLSKAQISYILSGLPGANVSVPGHAEGGEIDGHNPQFFSEGGLGSIENRYVQGEGDGTSDSVAAMLANGEFVIPADVVSKLGNGSNEAGAGVLDQLLVEIRKHAHSNGEKLPPESKGPLGYLLDAKRKVKA